MTNAESISAILALLRERQSFFITSHARPDGDAIGSALGMMHFLEALGKDVTVAFADPIPAAFQSLPGADRITATFPSKAPDAAILLEISSFDRSGFTAAQFEQLAAPVTINIDHHLSGREFATFNWIDPHAAAVGVMLYDLVAASGIAFTPAIATCLYTAVLTDTGCFTYGSTDASTFALASHLVAYGANPTDIALAVYSTNPPSRLRLLGIALSNMRIEGAVATSSISLEEMTRAGATSEDTEGIINQILGVAGVKAAAMLRETPAADGKTDFRTSLRSKGQVDVSKVAERFSGGGHRNASGCNVPGPLPEALARITAELQAATAAA